MAEDSISTAESPIPPAILRGLGDRSYDKRKAAALEVEALVRSLQESGDTEKISKIMMLLAQDFAKSRNANYRKGGLIGLAASAIGVMGEIDRYLDILIPAVLECFDDPESRVRYYACESMYNIAKVARSHILRYFNRIFDGLCKLFADVDVDVKNGANLLDRLIKDIVTESDTFDVEAFIPLLQKYIKRTNPYVRQLLVGWITVLDSVPDINMLDWLPDFLDGLFNMLSDGNREIRQAADNALAEFLKGIKQAEVVELGPMVEILVNQAHSKERFNRLTAMTWLLEFIVLGGDNLLKYLADMLRAIMHCISDQEPEIRQVADEANQALLSLVQNTKQTFELAPLIQILTNELLSDHVPTRMGALNWISMLLTKDPQKMQDSIPEILPALLKTLSDEADEVILFNLQVLARISLDEAQFERVLDALVQLFMEDRRLLESRGSLIIRKLCVLLDSSSIYIRLAAVLNEKTDLDFVSIMVQSLNLILLTATELAPLRLVLKGAFQADASPTDKKVFDDLFACWSHSPVSTFSLCLLAQAYDLSSALIDRFAEVDVTVGFLMQIDKLVQLLESPIFVHLRLQLLEVHAPFHADLLRSLYGLLMLLPQSNAYKTLSDRLATVSSLSVNLVGRIPPREAAIDEQSQQRKGLFSKSPRQSRREIAPADYTKLLDHFTAVQARHQQHRLETLRTKSLRQLQQV